MPATQVYLVGSRDNLFGLQPISDLIQEELQLKAIGQLGKWTV